jgi:putative transcriptional regulator
VSDISEAIHASAAMLHKAGALDRATMRDFDARHLVIPSEIETAEIKQLRLKTEPAPPPALET